MTMRLVPTNQLHDQIILGPFLGRRRKTINILRAVWIDTGRDYLGRLGAKDLARRQKAGAA